MIRREWFRANWRVPVLATLAFAGMTVSLSAQDDAVSELKAAVAALQSKREAAAIAILKGLDRKLPQIADYIGLVPRLRRIQHGKLRGGASGSGTVWSQTPTSPLIGRAALLGAQAYRANRQHLRRRQLVAQILHRDAAAARRPGDGQSFRRRRRSRERRRLRAACLLRLSGCERSPPKPTRWRRIWNRNSAKNIRRPWATPCWAAR